MPYSWSGFFPRCISLLFSSVFSIRTPTLCQEKVKRNLFRSFLLAVQNLMGASGGQKRANSNATRRAHFSFILGSLRRIASARRFPSKVFLGRLFLVRFVVGTFCNPPHVHPVSWSFLAPSFHLFFVTFSLVAVVFAGFCSLRFSSLLLVLMF